MLEPQYSIDPLGNRRDIPDKTVLYYEELRIKDLVKNNPEKTVVVVMGVGFVGTAMAAVIAENPEYLVIGYQRPSERSYWKVEWLQNGWCPIESEDVELEDLIGRGVDSGRLTATACPYVLEVADIIVVDVQCDYKKTELGNCRTGSVELGAFEEAMSLLGQKMKASALVLIETTVPPGTTEFVAWPILKKGFEARRIQATPKLAHSYERVMPGQEYVSSIRNYWRVMAACSPEAAKEARAFLHRVIDTKNFPLTVLDRPIESETAKVVENSFRAVTLAFMDEWCVFAERNGVDLAKVVDAIRMRPTHNNLLFPGPGIGGYCLPKDGPLGMWAYKHLMGFEDGDRVFKITPMAVDINDTRGLHAAELVRDALRALGRYVASSKVLVAGASYREDVGDTRWSGSELVVRKLTEMGAEVRVTDPHVKEWPEFSKQNSYPVNWMHRGAFFRNQESLIDLEVDPELGEMLLGIDALVLAVPHQIYKAALDPKFVVGQAGHPIAVVDCFRILSDRRIQQYLELGCEVKAMGRGHIERLRREL